MRTKSTVYPTKFIIERKGNNCSIVLCDIDTVKEVPEIDHEEEEIMTMFEFDMFRVDAVYRDTLEEELSDAETYSKWLEFARVQEYNIAAEEVREKRNKLLAETDPEMVIDRIGLAVPDGTTFTAWLSFLRGLGNVIVGDMAKYRQALRDITKQEGFPFDVKFPKRP